MLAQATLEGGVLDPWTNVERGVAHPGYAAVARSLDRWRAKSPAFLRNGVAAREEILADPLLEDDKAAVYAFERELYLQALHAPLSPSSIIGS